MEVAEEEKKFYSACGKTSQTRDPSVENVSGAPSWAVITVKMNMSCLYDLPLGGNVHTLLET